MNVLVNRLAPTWAHELGRSVDKAIGDNIWPFISRKIYTTSELTAALAVANPYGAAFVSNGTGNRLIAYSNGTAFYYADGTAV